MEYTVIRTKRKTISITVNKDLEIMVKSPLKTSGKYLDTIVQDNMVWIENQRNKHVENKKNAISLSNDDIEKLIEEAKVVLTQKTEYFSKIMKLNYTNIRISKAKTLWGSCNYQNAISYSYRVMLLDEDCIDYIVVHELSHIKHKNHSKWFYNEIEKILPNYKITEKKIKNFSNYDLY